MKETQKNHIAPKSFLSFWENSKNKLTGYNKCSKKYFKNTNATEVCFEKHLLHQYIENYFTNQFDGQIKPIINDIINDIIKTKEINENAKRFFSKFLCKQHIRNPFTIKIVNKIYNDYVHTNIHEKDISNILYKANFDKLEEIYFNKKWNLLYFETPYLITNEAMFTYELNNHGFVTYFPITPRCCITLRNDDFIDNNSEDTMFFINNVIANMPDTKYIIFVDSYDPMQHINLIEKP